MSGPLAGSALLEAARGGDRAACEQVLLENQGNVVSRETLMQRLWETNSFIDENTLSVNVARLRKKLDALGLTDFIITKKGLGYLVP